LLKSTIPFLPVRVFDQLISNSSATRTQHVDPDRSSNNNREIGGCVVIGLEILSQKRSVDSWFFEDVRETTSVKAAAMVVRMFMSFVQTSAEAVKI
jgi:hypothetical protein